MADSKITALTAISTVDPTADPLVIVDVSDTSMAASGTTKKSTINQLLGSGGTATLASATITGDLTVDTSTLKVDSANNRVGIGTATPDATLDVTSAGTASTYTVSAVIQDGTYPASGNPTLEFNGFIGGNGYRSGIGSIGGQQLAFYTPSTFGVAPTRRMIVDSSGNLSVDNGNVVLGTSGKGIDFSATSEGSGTMTSELLNDYEEGTWTIGLKFGGASVGLTTSANTGRYTKVGRQVSISGTLQLTNKGSSTGSATITGLPFGVGTNNEAYAAANLRLSGVSYTGAFQAFVANATPVIYIEQISTLGVATDLTDSNYTNSSSMIFNLTYTV